MKVAVIGSRSLTVQNLGEYLPQGVTESYPAGQRGLTPVPESMLNGKD